MSFIIDTSVLIEIEKGNDDVISSMKRLNLQGDAYITSPTFSEFYFGLLGFPKDKLDREIQRLYKYKLLNTTMKSSIILAELKKNTESIGGAIPVFDLFIASIAICSGIQFITLDAHFKKVPNLKTIFIE